MRHFLQDRGRISWLAWWRKARGGLALVIPGGILLSLLAFTVVRHWDAEKLRMEFHSLAEERHAALERELEANLRILVSVQAFYAGSDTVTRTEFHAFSQHFLALHKSLQALEWIPRVLDGERQVYEKAAEKDGFPAFRFRDRKAQRDMVPSPRREAYFPVYYVEPYHGNELALGFDLGSNPVRKEALEEARDRGGAVATARVTLVQEQASQFGVLVFAPIYRRGVVPSTLQDRRRDLYGFALGVFRIGDILEKSLSYLKPEGIEIEVTDRSASGPERFLYHHAARLGSAEARGANLRKDTSLAHGEAIQVGGRTWEVVYQATPAFVAARRSWQGWAVLGIGLFLTAALAAYLKSTFRYTQALAVAKDRLEAQSVQLQQEVVERTRTEQSLAEALDLNQKMVESSPIGILVYHGLSGRCEFINDAAASIMEADREQLLEQDFRKIKAWQAAGILPLAEKTLETGAVQSLEIQGTTCFGKDIWLAGSFSTFLRGAEPHLLLLVQDLTERKRMERQLLEASRKAGMAEVAASVLHNVGNVLNSVNISASILHDRAQDPRLEGVQKVVALLQEHSGELPTFLEQDPKGQQVLPYLAKLGEHLLASKDMMLAETDRLLRSVEHIKNVIRTQQDFASSRGIPERVKVQDVIEEALEVSLRGRAADRKEIRIERNCGEMPSLLCEKHKLMQILVNLFQNARQAVWRADSEDKVVRVQAEASEDRVLLRISDNGEGIRPEHLARIFEHGFTTRPDGHGFGLHISALAASEMGGRLTCRSEGPGKGATFILELPIRQKENA